MRFVRESKACWWGCATPNIHLNFEINMAQLSKYSPSLFISSLVKFLSFI
uniref:Uncharacterized protein n=1 Tax=Arabidopsis thaliana TaxID=3702 RepID=Q0WM05_ARATH|nr:hypothetical protein [Arabidopsis thaliana]